MDIKLSNKKVFEDYLKQTAEDYLPMYIIDELRKFGETFIRDARTKQQGSFNNITTRLRNSIGYVVSRDGVVKKSDFDSYSVSGSATEEGKQLGLQYATEIAQEIQGYALVCVAGADYGLYVEAKGYDVITGSVLTLRQELIKKW